MGGRVDTYTSRRTNYLECMFWSQKKIKVDEDLKDLIHINELGEIHYDILPTGIFYATEIDTYSKDNQILAGAFMFEENTTTIKTSDYIPDLKQNDYVVFEDNIWRVTNIGKQKVKKRNKFTKDCAYTYYISLKR